MNNLKTSWVFAGHLQNAIKYGAQISGGTDGKGAFSASDMALHFNHHAEKTDAGAELKYNFASKQLASRLGLKLAQDDHAYKFRLHNNGLVVAAL